MGKDWIEYQCTSGQTLLLYNKVTGEHKWPHGLPEGIMYSNPVTCKEFSTIATQTDDNGCNNGCMSMYINRHPSYVRKICKAVLPQQQHDVSLEENTLSYEVRGFRTESRDEKEIGRSSGMLTVNQSNFVVKSSGGRHENCDDHSYNSLGGTADRNLDQKLHKISEISRECEGMKPPSTAQNMINYSNFDMKSDIDNDSDDGDKRQPDHNNLISISRSELEQVVNVLEDAERSSEVDMINRSDKTNEHATNIDSYKSPEWHNNSTAHSHHNYLFPNKVHESKTHQERNLMGNHTYTSKEKNFECSYCQRKFTQKCNLNVHIRTHTGVKPYVCSYCKKPFADKSSLTKHIRIHTGETPFQCSLCDKKFKRKDALNAHVKTHTGEKPHQCTICNTKFAQRGNLKVHFKTHTGEKSFECSICKKKFSRKSTLKIHLEVEHQLACS